MYELDQEETAIVALVRDWVDREVKPVVRGLEHANTYPEALIEQMKQMGIFGLVVPEPWGDAQVSTPCYAAVTEELARGWMSLAGAMGGHTVVAKLLLAYGTQQQKDTLPAADGHRRGPRHDGADRARRWLATCRPCAPPHGVTVTSTSSTARRRGSPTPAAPSWSRCCARPTRRPSRRTAGISILLAEKGPGFTVSAGPAQARLQGRGELRARLRRLPGPGQPRCSAGARVGASRR